MVDQVVYGPAAELAHGIAQQPSAGLVEERAQALEIDAHDAVPRSAQHRPHLAPGGHRFAAAVLFAGRELPEVPAHDDDRHAGERGEYDGENDRPEAYGTVTLQLGLRRQRLGDHLVLQGPGSLAHPFEVRAVLTEIVGELAGRDLVDLAGHDGAVMDMPVQRLDPEHPELFLESEPERLPQVLELREVRIFARAVNGVVISVPAIARRHVLLHPGHLRQLGCHEFSEQKLNRHEVTADAGLQRELPLLDLQREDRERDQRQHDEDQGQHDGPSHTSPLAVSALASRAPTCGCCHSTPRGGWSRPFPSGRSRTLMGT